MEVATSQHCTILLHQGKPSTSSWPSRNPSSEPIESVLRSVFGIIGIVFIGNGLQKRVAVQKPFPIREESWALSAPKTLCKQILREEIRLLNSQMMAQLILGTVPVHLRPFLLLICEAVGRNLRFSNRFLAVFQFILHIYSLFEYLSENASLKRVPFRP